MYLLEMNNIQKSYGSLDVIKDISLKVEEGEIVSIIGPSGSGKSTLLRCATMLETVDKGEIVYLGEKAVWTEETSKGGQAVYAKKRQLKEIQKNYGLVFQNFNLFPHYSVLKNVMDAPVSVCMGIRCALFTDIDKDGAMQGANVEETVRMQEETGLSVIASGGISSMQDVRALQEKGVYGAVLGKALYEGTIDLKEALAACGEN